MRAVSVTSVGLLLSASLWTVLLAADPPRDDLAVILMSASLWATTVISLTGMLVARARWARRLGIVVTGGHGAVAILLTPGLWWGVGMILSAATALALSGPWLDGYIRGRPSAAGPPTRAVLVPLVLAGVPFALGWAGADNVPGAALAASAWVAAFWFIRTLPGAVAMVRIVWPAVAVGLTPWLNWPQRAAAVAAAATVAAMAWHSSVRVAVRPLVERGSIVPIPPELAPREILDAADIDDRGRPR